MASGRLSRGWEGDGLSEVGGNALRHKEEVGHVRSDFFSNKGDTTQKVRGRSTRDRERAKTTVGGTLYH